MAKRSPQPPKPLVVAGVTLPAFPAGWKRYRSVDAWTTAIWRVLNESAELNAVESDLRKLGEEMHDNPPHPLGYWGRDWLTLAASVRHAVNCFRDALKPNKLYSNDDRPATDRKNWHPDLIAATWAEKVAPALERARKLLALARDPATYAKDRDPQELVEWARANGGDEFVRHVIEAVHKFRFETSHQYRDQRVLWYDITAGRKTVADAFAWAEAEAKASRAREEEYARHALRAYKAAAAALAVGKDTDHLATVNRRLKAAKAGHLLRNGRYADRRRDAKTADEKTEWFLWAEYEGKGATAIVAKTIRQVIDRLRVLVLSVNEEQVTPEILDKLRKG